MNRSKLLRKKLSNVALSQGLVAYYKFDGDVTDSIGGFDGSIVGDIGFVDGVKGQAISIDGLDNTANRVEIPQSLNTTLGQTDTISISLRLRSGAMDGWTNQGVFELGFIEDDNGAILLRTDSGGELLIRHDYGAIESSLATGLADTLWYKVNIVYDGNSVKSFIDNQLVDEFTYTGVIDFTDNRINNPSSIGTYFRINDYELNYRGDIDEFMIHNRALSEPEIKKT